MLIFFFLVRTAYNLSNVSTAIDEPIGGPNVRPLEAIRTAVQTHMLGIDVLTPRGELPKLVELIRKHCIETHFEVQQPLLDKHLNANLLARRIDPAVPPHAFNAHAEQLGSRTNGPNQLDPTKWTQPFGPNQLDPNQSKQLLC